MKKVLIDLLKLSNLNCGLGQVALNFGKALCESYSIFDLNYLVPKNFVGYFGDSVNYFTPKTIKKSLSAFDLWHCIHQEPKFLPAKDTKLLITIHDLNFIGEKSERKSAVRLKKLQNLADRTDKIVFISDFSRKTALENLNYPTDKTTLIYNGVTTSGDFDEPRLKFDKFFFSIGVFKPKKNFHVLIPLMKHFPDHKLIIAGENKGSYYKQLLQLSKKDDVDDRVLFPGIISEEEKTWYYKNCEAFLFPSLHEGFGLPVIEAMQNGTPVITSDKTSLPEIGGGFSFIFHSFDEITIKETILQAIKKHSSDTEFNKNAIAYARQYNWNKNASEYLELYNEICCP